VTAKSCHSGVFIQLVKNRVAQFSDAGKWAPGRIHSNEFASGISRASD
jgi:hypothetical protein